MTALGTSEPETWYTDDPILYPPAVIWRTARRLGPLGPSVFLLTLLRRSLGLRPAATYGTTRPNRLPVVPNEEVPLEVRERMAPALRACGDAGMRLCFICRPAFLGSRSAYSATLSDASETTFATVIRLRTAARGQVLERTIFSCHSETTGGVRMSTAASPPAEHHPEMIPSHVDLVVLPPETFPDAVITSHAERIESRKDLLRFDCESLRHHALEDWRRHFDWRVERGFLVPLNPKEVRRLTASHA